MKKKKQRKDGFSNRQAVYWTEFLNISYSSLQNIVNIV